MSNIPRSLVVAPDELVGRKQADFDRYFGPVLGPGLAGEERLTPHLVDGLEFIGEAFRR